MPSRQTLVQLFALYTDPKTESHNSSGSRREF